MNHLNVDRLMKELSDILSEKHSVKVVITATKKSEEETHEAHR